jgi:hypothetical protein
MTDGGMEFLSISAAGLLCPRPPVKVEMCAFASAQA